MICRNAIFSTVRNTPIRIEFFKMFRWVRTCCNNLSLIDLRNNTLPELAMILGLVTSRFDSRLVPDLHHRRWRVCLTVNSLWGTICTRKLNIANRHSRVVINGKSFKPIEAFRVRKRSAEVFPIHSISSAFWEERHMYRIERNPTNGAVPWSSSDSPSRKTTTKTYGSNPVACGCGCDGDRLDEESPSYTARTTCQHTFL